MFSLELDDKEHAVLVSALAMYRAETARFATEHPVLASSWRAWSEQAAALIDKVEEAAPC